MPHSLRVKIKNLRYKRIITDKDCERLCKALDNEKVFEQIRDEIADLDRHYDNDHFSGNDDAMFKCDEVLQIIDKYKAESEDNNE